MSAKSSSAVHETSAPFTTPQPDPGENSSIDARWAAWIERARQDELAMKRNLRMALLGTAVIGVLLALFFGLTSGAR